MTTDRAIRILPVITVLFAVIAVAVPLTAVRVIAGVPLTLFAPGYALTAVIFARQPLMPVHRALLTVALSVAILALGTVLLNYTPGGITEISWAVLLVVLTVTACVVAQQRRRWIPHPVQRLRFRLMPGFASVALLAGALLAGGAAFALAWTPVGADNVVGYTQLSMLPLGGDEVRIGVLSQEHDETTYRLDVNTGLGGAVLGPDFVLQPGDKRVIETSIDTGETSKLAVVSLYLADRPDTAYRRVTARLPAPADSP